MHFYLLRSGAGDAEAYASEKPLRLGEEISIDGRLFRVLDIDTSSRAFLSLDVEPIEAPPT